MIALLIVLVSIASYAVMGGLVGRTFCLNRIEACDYHSGRKTGLYDRRCIDSHGAAGFFAGLGWPFMVPVSLGMKLADAEPRAARKQTRLAQKQQAELDAAKHKQELTRIQEDTIRMLEEANRR